MLYYLYVEEPDELRWESDRLIDGHYNCFTGRREANSRRREVWSFINYHQVMVF